MHLRRSVAIPAERDRVPDRLVRRAAVDAGDDVQVIAPIPSFAAIGAIVVKPDGKRILTNVERDPLATPPDDEPADS